MRWVSFRDSSFLNTEDGSLRSLSIGYVYIYICICIGGVDSCHLFVIDVFPFIIRDDDVKGVQNVSLSLSSVLTKAPMMLMMTTTTTNTTTTTTTTTAAVVVP